MNNSKQNYVTNSVLARSRKSPLYTSLIVSAGYHFLFGDLLTRKAYNKHKLR